MSSYQTGRSAEKQAAEYLTKRGYKIIDNNWKTEYCEIDIVAKKKKTIFLVEVKYRSNNKQGPGYEYVTPRKLEQMRFAAEIWVNYNDWQGDYQLAVASIDGNNITFFDEIY